jgi:tetraacyldisaccharide 4'-kinase
VAGDEPALMKRVLAVPVFVASQRAEAARALLAKYPNTQCLVCDDGLQHYALQRDVEICVFDARGVGNGWQLPAGPLREAWPREPLAQGERPAPQGLVLTPNPASVATPPQFQATRLLADFAVNAAGQRTPLHSLRDKPVVAVAAIARPEQFFDMLRDQGLDLSHTEVLPDHYNFDSWLCRFDKDKILICTEKDAVKLWITHPQALAVPLTLQLEPAFWTALDRALDQAVEQARRLATAQVPG